jgi:hypothetical protein
MTCQYYRNRIFAVLRLKGPTFFLIIRPSSKLIQYLFVNCSVTVHITVVDVNEYAPIFLEPSYVKQVDEGRLFEQILRVEATDRDCTAKFGDICKYEILTLDQPFAIDSDGKDEDLVFH